MADADLKALKASLDLTAVPMALLVQRECKVRLALKVRKDSMALALLALLETLALKVRRDFKALLVPRDYRDFKGQMVLRVRRDFKARACYGEATG